MPISGDRAYSLLKKIAFTRPAGSPEELRAAVVLADEVQSLGLDVSLEPFSIEAAEFTTTEFTVTYPYKKFYTVKGYEHSKNTPSGGIDAEFIYLDNLTKESLRSCAGRVVLCEKVGCSTQDIAESDVVAFAVMDGKATDDPLTTDLNSMAFRTSKDRGLVTAYTIRARDALEMVRRGAQRVHMVLHGKTVERTSHNVITSVNGTGNPDEVVVFGAHYDSIPFGQGASDNAAGSVCIMELLRYFVENPPKRSLKFVWFGAEEVGLLGSKEYLKVHEAELKTHKLMINMDVGGSVMGHNFVRATCEESVAHYLQFLASEVGYQADIKQGLMGSDSTPFADLRIPAVGFGRGAAHGLEFAHSRHDTIDYISPERLAEVTGFVRLFADRVIGSKQFPIPQTIPDNVVLRINQMLRGNEGKKK